MWLEKFGPPEVTQTTWRLHKSKIDPCLQCRHHPRSFSSLSCPHPTYKGADKLAHKYTHLHTFTHVLTANFPSLPLFLSHRLFPVSPSLPRTRARCRCPRDCAPVCMHARRSACSRRGRGGRLLDALRARDVGDARGWLNDTTLGSNGNVVEKRHRHRPSDLLVALSSYGDLLMQDAKDEGRIIYELLYVCGGKGWGRTPVASCQRSYRDLNVHIFFLFPSIFSLNKLICRYLNVHISPTPKA